MFERIRRYIPTTVLSLVVFPVQVYPGCTAIVWHVLELLIDVFMLWHSPVLEITDNSVCISCRQNFSFVYSHKRCCTGVHFRNWICTALSYRSCLLACVYQSLAPAFSIPVTKNVGWYRQGLEVTRPASCSYVVTIHKTWTKLLEPINLKLWEVFSVDCVMPYILFSCTS